MAMVATDIKDLLKINIKSRHDSYTDQYNRLFMVKLLLVSSVVMGISWYGDSINCIVPESHGLSEKFVSSACWIQGVYVYKELKKRFDDIAYFGIPKDIDNDGMLPSGHLCPSTKKLTEYERLRFKECAEMEKTFFLQYQWMPFLIAAFSILYYLPYVFYKKVNSDLISLKASIKEKNPDAEKIAKYYFKANGRRGPNLCRMLYNLIIKLLYGGANVVTFFSLNYLLNGDYFYYGREWINWGKLNNTLAHDYMGLRDFPKPGNQLLPPFGYCELYQSAKDVLTSLSNKHKFVCELSQNILYQYCLLLLWFAVILGAGLSAVGFLLLIFHYLFNICIKTRFQSRKKIYGVRFSIRELEYLDLIKTRSNITYGEVLQKIREQHNNN